MPLMSSTSLGNLLIQAATPPTSLTGYLWYDTVNNVLKNNISGTWTTILNSAASQIVTNSPSDPSPTTSATKVMCGFAIAFTPTKSGKIKVWVKCAAQQNTAADGGTLQIRYGTGTAPVNGAAVTGTASGTPTQALTFLTPNQTYPLGTMVGYISDAVVNTALWFDLAMNVLTGGQLSPTSITFLLVEEQI